MFRSSCSFFLLAALLICAFASSAQAQSDQVFGANGTPTRGAITKMTPVAVTMETSGVSRDYPVNDIQKVTFGDDPAELRRARDAAMAGRYDDALKELAPLNVATVERAVVKQDVEYYKAFAQAKLALEAGGDSTQAAGAMFKFLQGGDTSWHYFEAVRLFGDLAVSVGRFDSAEEYYKKYGQAPWPEYKLQAAVLLAKAYVAQDKYAEALPLYTNVSNAGSNSPEANTQKAYARVGIAVCKAHIGDPQEGIGLIEDMIAKGDPKDMALFGRAYNALGSCYLAAKKPEDATLAYLHTDILFYGDGEVHAEALYQLSKLWDDLQKPDRASSARKLLKTRYAGSRWASLDN